MDQTILFVIIGVASLSGGLLIGKLVFARNTKKQVEEAEAQLAKKAKADAKAGRKAQKESQKRYWSMQSKATKKSVKKNLKRQKKLAKKRKQN